jgi:hypothetical protein
MGDYNKCVEENLRLKEFNMKLGLKKQSLSSKLEIATKKLNIMMHNQPEVNDSSRSHSIMKKQ